MSKGEGNKTWGWGNLRILCLNDGYLELLTQIRLPCQQHYMGSSAVHVSFGGGDAGLEYDEDYGWALDERIRHCVGATPKEKRYLHNETRLLYSRTSLPVDNPPITSRKSSSLAPSKVSYVPPPSLLRSQPPFKHNANQKEVGNNTRPIATITDDHLEMLTRLRVRAASRAEARERIFTETSIILATLHDITNEPYPYQLQVVTLLHTME
ncbi:hypothetical protein N7455_007939 [Penicillium solitum]|uniref:uncharacterized protein n=1 Tax=Penicillium solitum TaxID=60172 RepID=UPI0018370C1D|nr:hypothetical protein HAV15_004400 [Penicillium sp. str. \